MELIGTALGHHVDHAAGRTTEFSAVIAGDHLLLRNAVERQGGGTQVGQRVGNREAVDVEGVFRCCRTTERCGVAVAGVSLHHARRQQCNGRDAVLHRDVFQLFRGKHGPRIRLRYVDTLADTGAANADRTNANGVRVALGAAEVDFCTTADHDGNSARFGGLV